MTGNAFLAVPLSTSKRHELAAALHVDAVDAGVLSSASPGFPIPGKRVHPDNWHVTVRFLGECEDLILDRVAAALDESLDADGGTGTLSGIDAFPRSRKASIIYAAVDDDGSLAYLAARCEELVRDVGFPPEERPFIPHLTLSRLRPRRDVTHLIRRFESFSVRLPLDSVVLYRTTRTSEGV